jgi:hypothetical protein
MDMNGSILSSIKAAESGLARQANKELEEIAKRFPDDHPISEEYKRLTIHSSGELTGLPANHPFIMTLKDVKRKMEAQENPEEAERQDTEVRKENEVRRSRRRQEARQQRLKEEEQKSIRRMASPQLNMQIGKVEKELENLYATVESVSEEMSGDT